MNPQLESIKKQALAINDTLNTKATAQGKATQTFDAAGRATRVPPSTNIPVAAIENTSPAPVQVPPVSFDPNQSLQSALTASEQVFEGERVRSEQELAAASNKESATDARLKELFGVMGQAPEVKRALEDQEGLRQKKNIVNQISAKAGLVADDLDLFKLNTEAVSRQNELEASKRDFTKGTFSAADTRMRTERALEANARASELVGLRAQYAIAEGNVTLANEAVAQAMDIFYKPIEMELELEKKFFDRNTARMNEAQRSAADVRLKQAEARGEELRGAKEMVNAAVATGNISTDELAEMLKLNGDPEAQSAYAAKIVARTNAADRALQQQMQRMQIASLQASIDEKNAATTEGKPLTQSQYAALNFGSRMQQANVIVDELGTKMVSPMNIIARKLPNFMKTPDQQRFEQAQNNFINAVLRRESGAQITPSEFESATVQYFPQPGDSEAVLAQKALNRNLSIKNFLNEAGQDTTPQDMAIADPLGLGVGAGAAPNPLGI